MTKSEQARADAMADAETLAMWGGPWVEPMNLGSWVVEAIREILTPAEGDDETLDHGTAEASLVPWSVEAARAAFRAVPGLRA